MMKRMLKLAALALMAALLLTGCMDMSGMFAEDDAQPAETMPPMTAEMFTDRQATYQYYNEVTLDDTLATLTERYGEPRIEANDNGDSYFWVMDNGCGVVVSFFDSGRLRAKVLYYEDVRQLGALSEATNITSFSQLNKDYTYEMTCGVLGGKPMELAQIVQDTSADPEVKRLYVWSTSKGDIVQVLFTGAGKIESVNYTLAE